MTYQFAGLYPRGPLSGLFAALFLAAVPAPALAEGEVVLTVAGGATTLDLDMDAIEAMPQVSFRTATNWTDGVSTFTGVALKHLLERAGATGSDIHATALNSYSAVIPMDSIDEDSPIVAYAIDGVPFPRRDKGPLLVVYPFDVSDAFRNDVIYGRSVWQLRSLSVR